MYHRKNFTLVMQFHTTLITLQMNAKVRCLQRTFCSLHLIKFITSENITCRRNIMAPITMLVSNWCERTQNEALGNFLPLS